MKRLLLIIMAGICFDSFALSITDVKNEVLSQDIKFPFIVVAQTIQECGWDYNSYNARKRNNLFGLWDSSTKTYMSFESWELSVKAYKEKIQSRYREGEDYYSFLNRIGYASDEDYNSKLKWIVQKINTDYFENN